jgi:hypothetical protein
MSNEKKQGKSKLAEAVETALNLPTESERVIAIIRMLKPYKNEAHPTLEVNRFEGYEKCRTGLEGVKNKVLKAVSEHYGVELPKEEKVETKQS